MSLMPLAINFASKLLAESYQAHSPVEEIGSIHHAHANVHAKDATRPGLRSETHQTAFAGAVHNSANWVNEAREQRRESARQLAF